MLATIRIKDLRLRTYIGFNDEEKTKKQDVVVNIHLKYDASRAAESDSVADACNYKTLTKQIIALVEQGNFDLLEKMAADIIKLIEKMDIVLQAHVEIDKPHALRFADSVSVAMSYQR
jgi:D-erythro-7,8-dihydroneopterin triphosphate epimerase